MVVQTPPLTFRLNASHNPIAIFFLSFYFLLSLGFHPRPHAEGIYNKTNKSKAYGKAVIQRKAPKANLVGDSPLVI